MSNFPDFPSAFVNSPFYHHDNEYYDGYINFTKLFEYIKKGLYNEKTIEIFDYINFVSDFKKEYFVPHPKFDYLEKRYDPANLPYETMSPENEKILLQPKTRLYKRIENIYFVPDYFVKFSFDQDEITYMLAYKYIESDIYAIRIETNSFKEFETILYISSYNIFDDTDIKNKVIEYFEIAFENANDDRNKLDWLYEKAPMFVIEKRGINRLIKDLSLILEGLVDEIGTNEEKVIFDIFNALLTLNVLNSEERDLKIALDSFLDTLITKKVKKVTLFERLYSKMNDKGFGDKNFKKIVNKLFNIWMLSSWTNPEIYHNDNTTGVENLCYKNKRILGFNSNDFDFYFYQNIEKNLVIKVHRPEMKKGYVRGSWKEYIPEYSAIYHPYQPIRLPMIPEHGNFSIDNTIIPAFYLKAFDDKGAWENFEKGAWLTLDVLTTFSGIGNVIKFRNLLRLYRLGEMTDVSRILITLKFTTSVVQVTTGTLGILLGFSDKCNSSNADKIQKELCEHLRNYLFLLDIASLSVDSVVERLLKKEAKMAIEAAEKLLKNTDKVEEIRDIKKIISSLEEIGLLKRISKSFKGIDYDILVYQYEIVWLVKNNNKIAAWENKVRLWGGELEFDFNTFGEIKGLGQQWADETFELFGNRIKKIKVEWKEGIHYPNGQSLGFYEYNLLMDKFGDSKKAVMGTTFYQTMSKKGFKEIESVSSFESIIVILK